MNKFLLSFLVIGLAACAPVNESQLSQTPSFAGIVGGEAATEQDAFSKSVVAVLDVFQGGVCTGTLITKNIVVTAAHCVQNGAQFLQVGFGLELDKSRRIQVAASTFHERYTQAMIELEGILQQIVQATTPGPERQSQIMVALDDYKNWGDIALIKMKGDAPAGYEPAEILHDGRYLQNGATVLLAGYGITKPYSEQNSDEPETSILRKVETKVHDAVFSETEVALNQTEGKGACHGDSGGPAFVKMGDHYLLFGVTSRGLHDPEDSCRQYSGYTYLPAFFDWAASVVGNWQAAANQQQDGVVASTQQ